MQSERERVYSAPVIPWNNGTYTPISNKSIMDLMDEKLRELDLKVKHEEYRVAANKQGLVRGVVGTYDICTGNEEFGQRIMIFLDVLKKNVFLHFKIHPTMKKMSYRNKVLLAAYIVWVCGHFLYLMASGESDQFYVNGLYPLFRQHDNWYFGYGWFDFIIYAIIPWPLYFLAKLLNDIHKEKQSKSQATYA